MNETTSRRRWRPGFSLVELVMVMATIALLVGMAFPRYFRSLQRYRVEIAAKRIAADLSLARMNARSASTNQHVDFSSPTDGYKLTGMKSRDRVADDYVVRLAEEPYRVTISSATFGSGASAGATVTFDRYGQPNRGGTVVVQSGDFRRTIVLNAATGRTTIQ